MKGLLMVGVVVVAVVALGLAMESIQVHQSAKEPSAKPAAAPVVKETVEEMVWRLRSPEQAALENYNQAFREVGKAPNEIARAQVEKKWNDTYCNAVNRVSTFSGWVGIVNTIRWNGYFEAYVGEYTQFTDIDIQEGSPLFGVIAGLKRGQPVEYPAKSLRNTARVSFSIAISVSG